MSRTPQIKPWDWVSPKDGAELVSHYRLRLKKAPAMSLHQFMEWLRGELMHSVVVESVGELDQKKQALWEYSLVVRKLLNRAVLFHPGWSLVRGGRRREVFKASDPLAGVDAYSHNEAFKIRSRLVGRLERQKNSSWGGPRDCLCFHDGCGNVAILLLRISPGALGSTYDRFIPAMRSLVARTNCFSLTVAFAPSSRSLYKQLAYTMMQREEEVAPLRVYYLRNGGLLPFSGNWRTSFLEFYLCRDAEEWAPPIVPPYPHRGPRDPVEHGQVRALEHEQMGKPEISAMDALFLSRRMMEIRFETMKRRLQRPAPEDLLALWCLDNQTDYGWFDFQAYTDLTDEALGLARMDSQSSVEEGSS